MFILTFNEIKEIADLEQSDIFDRSFKNRFAARNAAKKTVTPSPKSLEILVKSLKCWHIGQLMCVH